MAEGRFSFLVRTAAVTSTAASGQKCIARLASPQAEFLQTWAATVWVLPRLLSPRKEDTSIVEQEDAGRGGLIRKQPSPVATKWASGKLCLETKVAGEQSALLVFVSAYAAGLIKAKLPFFLNRHKHPPWTIIIFFQNLP